MVVCRKGGEKLACDTYIDASIKLKIGISKLFSREMKFS
jgi:hypothetical protein